MVARRQSDMYIDTNKTQKVQHNISKETNDDKLYLCGHDILVSGVLNGKLFCTIYEIKYRNF